MTLARQFVRAAVNAHDGVWEATIVYSYYGLYQYKEHQVCGSLEAARMWILSKRCTLPGDVVAYDES